MPALGEPLNAERNTHATTDTQCGQSPVELTAAQFMQQRHENACARRTNRVPQSDGSAIHIDNGGIPSHARIDSACLSGKSLIGLDALLASLARFHPQDAEAQLAKLESEFPGRSFTQFEEIFLSRAIYRDPELKTLETHRTAGGWGAGYEFQWVPGFENGRLGAAHGFDEPFVFGDLSAVPLAHNDPSASALANEISSAIIAYAHNGECGWEGAKPKVFSA